MAVNPIYLNQSMELIYPAQRYINANWVRTPDANFFFKHVLSRGARLTLAPISVIVHALDIIVGLGAGAATAATLGMHKPASRFACAYLWSTNRIINDLFVNLLKTVNPTADFLPLFGDGTPGILARPVRVFLLGSGIQFSRSDNLLTRHVASRLTFALTAVALIVARTADAIIGVIAVPIAFLTLGLIREVNSVAAAGLEAPGVVNDVFHFLMLTINPWTEIVL